jgi:two-component system, NtrC family, response regulator AtoC
MSPVGQDTTIDADSTGPDAAQRTQARAYLVVRTGDDSRIIDVREGDDILLGRSEDATVRVEDAKASREHARILCTAGALVLHDLGSRNGTRVNRELVRNETRPLSPGDVLWIGQVEILVAGSGGAAAPSATPLAVPGIIVADEAMIEVFRVLDRVAPTQTTVLLLGETGVGKEIVAEQLHQRSPRAPGPFVRINCGALPENLIESELFGYERGAFTGADRRKAGLFEAAEGGTLFLDEIGELRLELQAKLLRALETRRLMRIGGREEVDIDVRVVSASNRDLEEEVKAGRFRGDLFFRLSTFMIKIPPLRERPNEIVLLAELFARQLALKMGKLPPRLSEPARVVLERYAWPGNVRELRNSIERALVLVDGDVIAPAHLGDSIRAARSTPHPSSIRSQLESVEQRAIEEALAAEAGNQTHAARRLGISRRTLIYRLEKYQLRPRDRSR